MNSTIEITLADRWHTLTSHGLRVGSPDVGMSRIQLVGTAEQWSAARDAIASKRERMTGANKSSATHALQRIDFALSH